MTIESGELKAIQNELVIRKNVGKIEFFLPIFPVYN